MTSKAERRQQERREKKRLKDRVRQGEARQRRARDLQEERASAERDPDVLAGLPLGECLASENWHEPGASVRAAISRRHPNGRVAAALYHIDLAAGALREARLLPDITADQLLGELGRQAGEDLAVAICEPPLVAALLEAVVDDLAADPRPAVRLVGDIDPADWPHEILVGPAPAAPPPAPEQGPGLLARLQGWLGRSRRDEEAG